METDNLILNLHQGDFSITNQVAEAINDVFGNGVAVPLDARSVKVRAPIQPDQNDPVPLSFSQDAAAR